MCELRSALDSLAADDLHAMGPAELLERIGELVRARVVEHLPAVAAAFADGQVTAEQIAVVAPVVTDERRTAAAEQGVELGVALGVVDAVLAETAAARQHAHLGQVVHHYLSRLDSDGVEPDPTEGRSLTVSRGLDGRLSLRGELDAVGGEKVQAMLESIVQADRPKGDVRTRSRQLGDALVQAADNLLAAGSAPGSLTTSGSTTTTVCTPPSATEPRPLTPCSTPNRPRDPGKLNVHHLLHWIDGGETSLENSALLCERHHTKVHHGFRVERQPDNRWRTYRPDGTEIVSAPLRV
ncbi:MAG: endonuclease [Blastococcus sp.]|jgi:hypothetical protein|nr:endonuclease [Blastococcus sp.]